MNTVLMKRLIMHIVTKTLIIGDAAMQYLTAVVLCPVVDMTSMPIPH